MAAERVRQRPRKGPIIGSIIMAAAIFGVSRDAAAYIGPGMAAGVVTSVLGILAGIGMVLVGIIWYPIKALLRKLRKAKK